jgi:hypothetical protein
MFVEVDKVAEYAKVEEKAVKPPKNKAEKVGENK